MPRRGTRAGASRTAAAQAIRRTAPLRPSPGFMSGVTGDKATPHLEFVGCQRAYGLMRRLPVVLLPLFRPNARQACPPPSPVCGARCIAASVHPRLLLPPLLVAVGRRITCPPRWLSLGWPRRPFALAPRYRSSSRSCGTRWRRRRFRPRRRRQRAAPRRANSDDERASGAEARPRGSHIGPDALLPGSRGLLRCAPGRRGCTSGAGAGCRRRRAAVPGSRPRRPPSVPPRRVRNAGTWSAALGAVPAAHAPPPRR